MITVALLFFLPGAFAADSSLIRIFADDANLKQVTASLEVNFLKPSCSLKIGQAMKSAAILPEACHSIAKLLKDRNRELNEIAKLGFGIDQRQKYEGAHLPLILLELDGKKFPVLKTGAEVCDASGKSCKPSSQLASDRLGFQVLKLLR